jgi:ATP-binding cassette subfamily C (CFTR/MRP) protein 1
VIPRISLIAFTLCQPLLLNKFINFLEDPDGQEGVNIGYGLIGAYGTIYLGISVSLFAFLKFAIVDLK